MNKKLTIYESDLINHLSNELYSTSAGIKISKYAHIEPYVFMLLFLLSILAHLTFDNLLITIINAMILSLFFMLRIAPYFIRRKILNAIVRELTSDYLVLRNTVSIDKFYHLTKKKYLKEKYEQKQSLISDIKAKYGISD